MPLSMPIDSRRFTRSHVRADFDFDGVRGFDTSLHVRIPAPIKYVGRDVVHQFRRFELWSPNSEKTPVYPGTKPAGLSLVPPLDHHRTDGSGGRFDWTLIPQHIDTNHLHHPFILDPARLKTRSPEYVYLTSAWEPLSPTSGRLRRDFFGSLISRAEKLESRRSDMLNDIPSSLQALASLVSNAPTVSDFQHFEGEITWDACVEGVVYLQRVMREKDAWLWMMGSLRSTKWSIEVPLVSPLPGTQEQFLGGWINGADERIANWLLHLGLPCFIIHDYREGLDFGPGISDRRSCHVTHSFCPEQVWHLLPNINAYEAVALRHPTPWSKSPPTFCYLNVIATAEALDLSSSQTQGYVRPASDVYQQPDPEDGDNTWPSVCLFKDRIPWVKPPPIMEASKKGAWSQFCIGSLDVDEGHPLHDREVMQERGKSFRGDSELTRPYYDRENKRQLYFTSPPPIPTGIVSDPAFGYPVPFYHFVGLVMPNQSPKTCRRSKWMYIKADPSPAEVGREAPVPTATQLKPYPRVPTDPYRDEDHEDDDEDDYPRHYIPHPGPPPPSPPASENMEPLHSIPDFDQDILSVLVTFQRPSLHAPPLPQAPALTNPSERAGCGSLLAAGAEASEQSPRSLSAQIIVPAQSEGYVVEDYPMEDLSSCPPTEASLPSQPSCLTHTHSHGAPPQAAVAVCIASAGHTGDIGGRQPSSRSTSTTADDAQKSTVQCPAVASADECSPSTDQVIDKISSASAGDAMNHGNLLPVPPGQDGMHLLPAPQPSIPALLTLSQLPPPTQPSNLETRCLIFQSLASGVTIDDIAEVLRAPAVRGGCGVLISSSAPIPSINSTAFVIEFGSIHEARLAWAGWSSRDSTASIGPASSSLASKLTPYQHPLESTQLDRFGASSTQHSTPQHGFMSPHYESRHPKPYPTSTKLPRPNKSSPHTVSRTAHNRIGYMTRKGTLPNKRVASSSRPGAGFSRNPR